MPKTWFKMCVGIAAAVVPFIGISRAQTSEIDKSAAPTTIIDASAAPKTQAAVDRITRARFALEYSEFDRRYSALFEAGQVDGPTKARINRTFDRLTREFFRKDQSRAMQMIEALTSSLPLPATGFRESPQISTSAIIGMDIARQKLVSRIIAAKENVPVWVVKAVEARLALLRDEPGEATAAQFLADRDQLRKQLEQEVASVEAGKNPYVGKVGTWWTLLTTASGARIPAFIHVPASLDITKPVPLLIALHGAGADESMFPFGYGAGRLSKLADEKGFIVVSPNTFSVLGSGTAGADVLAATLEQIASIRTIDTGRVYLLGHSLGAITAWGLVNQNPGEIAAIALIGAIPALPPDLTKVPPTLLMIGELDNIFPAKAAARRAIEMREKGAKLFEDHVVPDTGHTLIVGEELPGVIDWLLSR